LANATEAANASKKPSARLKVEAPDDFNGKPISIESFIRSLEFYYLSAGGELSDKEKVVYALSKIKGTETCDNWRDLIYQEIAALNGETGTWAEFMGKFRKGFTHIPNAEKAKNELQKISQGKNTAEEYVTWFKAIAMVSGLDYATWVMFFKKGLAGNLRDKIYNSEIVPGNDTKEHFEEWCKRHAFSTIIGAWHKPTGEVLIIVLVAEIADNRRTSRQPHQSRDSPEIRMPWISIRQKRKANALVVGKRDI